jgi:hypothetical protein
MSTQVIGIKDFRNQFTTLWKRAIEKNIRYIVLHHSKPVLEVNPLHEDGFVLEKLAKEVQNARAEVKLGKTYSQEEVEKMIE